MSENRGALIFLIITINNQPAFSHWTALTNGVGSIQEPAGDMTHFIYVFDKITIKCAQQWQRKFLSEGS